MRLGRSHTRAVRPGPVVREGSAASERGASSPRPRRFAGARARATTALGLLLVGSANAALAQSTGQILGRVIDAETREPIAGAEVRAVERDLVTLTSNRGEFILTGVPVGEHSVRVTRIGFRAALWADVRVFASRPTYLTIEMSPIAIELAPITADVERVRLLEPEVSQTHEVVLGHQIRALPVDGVAEVVELATGVSDGHFRGGRVGQESYVLDGFAIQSRLDASTHGPAFELSPTSLEEIDVVTGGLAAEHGAALSGMVRYVTRRGSADGWEGRAAASTDQWAPSDLLRGFSGVSLSGGGPVPLLGRGSTLFVDLLAQTFTDAEPRARGLTCLRQEDVDPELGERIRTLSEDPLTAPLHCPFTASRLPFQQGNKLIGFLRLDRRWSQETAATLIVLANRRQRQLYRPEFKYNPDDQLGLRTKGILGGITLDWTRHAPGRARYVTLRLIASSLDRYVGVVDPVMLETGAGAAGFAEFRFLGEEFTRRPIEEQLAAGTGVPGYERPGGSQGSPFGAAAEGIFFTEGTPDVVSWARSAFVGGEVAGELWDAKGHVVRGGASLRLYRVESYERVLAHLPGSAPTYARFYPATASAYIETQLAASDQVTLHVGVRAESFRSGLRLQRDRLDVSSPAVDTGWKTFLSPRIGVAAPVPGTNDRATFRLSYARLAQPPDFQFFLDTTLGDSLRTDVRRQGNPDLAFERGSSAEFGVRHLVTDRIAVGAGVFLKELTNLVTGSLSFDGFQRNEFTTGDFGSVRGLELTARGHWPGLWIRIGYALQSAKGVTSGPLDLVEDDAEAERVELPLEFDRRHNLDWAILAGRAAGDTATAWGAALTGFVRSGFPLQREPTDSETSGAVTRLPWTSVLDVRLSREMGRPPGCGRCRWRMTADLRNGLGRENVVALRRDTGTLAPTLADLEATAGENTPLEPSPRESPLYSEAIDLDRDGLVSPDEYRTARFAAALDRNDPSLFFGEARQLRIGVEVAF